MAHGDTHPEILRRQAELMRSLTPGQRVAIARGLTRTAVFLSRRALRRRHPDAGEAELDRRFAELHYGKELTRRLLGEP